MIKSIKKSNTLVWYSDLYLSSVNLSLFSKKVPVINIFLLKYSIVELGSSVFLDSKNLINYVLFLLNLTVLKPGFTTHHGP